jgi:hypothetical protein
MFLDRQLRTLETAKREWQVRDDLKRRLAHMEVLTAKTALRQAMAQAALGWAVAERVLAFFRKR